MQKHVIFIIAKQFFKKTFSHKGLFVFVLLYWGVQGAITIKNWQAYKERLHTIVQHQKQSRKSWDENPDKHPHRMAHFGSFVFRTQHPLSVFDSGIESYTGNAIFLEAHKQHTANFSMASVSTGIVRFGELTTAMLLQLIVPLILFFLGYAAITAERENGTLQMIYIQGASLSQILIGKSLGLFFVAIPFLLPSFLSLWSVHFLDDSSVSNSTTLRAICITLGYIIFYGIICLCAVLCSAKSTNSNTALLSMLSLWLLFFIMLPKTAQVIGNSLYPNLSKTAFKAAIATKISKQGNSHNPEDPYFSQLRDSVLEAHQVSDIKDLPFNYGGFLMRRGEKQSATIYNQQQQALINTYRKQNSIAHNLALLNPYLAIKNLSMGLSGSDFDTYERFLRQSEQYRYQQSQYMNELQMKFISNAAKSSEGKIHVVDNKYWQEFPEFEYRFTPICDILKEQILAIIALLLWWLGLVLIVSKFAHYFKI